MLDTLYIFAITVEAIAGALAAGRRNMDPVGVIFIACCTAIGGGTVRDLLLGNYPLVWVAHPVYVMITASAAMLTILVGPLLKNLRAVFLVLDAIGLITFTLIGVQKTLALGHGWLIAALMGMFTGIFGGIIRDVLCHRLPQVFRREVYASVAFLSAWLYLGLSQLGLPEHMDVLIILVVGIVLRLLAILYGIELPRFVYREWRQKD